MSNPEARSRAHVGSEVDTDPDRMYAEVQETSSCIMGA
jgi:hypothetical protein